MRPLWQSQQTSQAAAHAHSPACRRTDRVTSTALPHRHSVNLARHTGAQPHPTYSSGTHTPDRGKTAQSKKGSRKSKVVKPKPAVPIPGVIAGRGNGVPPDRLPAELLGESFEDAELTEEEIEQMQAQEARFMDAVVKVYCVHSEPNYSLPWQRKRQYASTSSGFIVSSGKSTPYLLTNAHSVEYHSQVKVKRRGDDEKFLAQVLAIGTECDIALLTVEDPRFWEGVTPLEFGPLPRLQDAVAVIGYPIGGDTISVTSGVVSRIEVTSYAHGSTELLAVQIDAAINSGNSGGPVFNGEGRCVGIAFQSIGGDAENVGYAIPLPVITHFLTDYERNGRYSGFPNLGLKFQRMESKSMREYYGMRSGQKGVLVRKVAPIAPAAALLRDDDVLMSFDGVQIANDGTVPFRLGERIAFTYLVSQKYTGEAAELEVLRKGEPHRMSVTLARPAALVPLHLAGKDPSFFIVAGLVFTSCTEPYLQSEYGQSYMTESPVKLLDALLYGFRQSLDEEVIVLSQVLACDATLGFEDVYDIQLKSFNGTLLRNLRHLAELVQANTEPFMRFDLSHEETIVLSSEVGRKATKEVLEAHAIPLDVSPDLKDLSAFPQAGQLIQDNAVPAAANAGDAADFAGL